MPLLCQSRRVSCRGHPSHSLALQNIAGVTRSTPSTTGPIPFRTPVGGRLCAGSIPDMRGGLMTGKDSSVMLHLALKAFYPSKPPFPLLHVDTTWKFREMIEFRDAITRKHGLELMVHVNPEALAMGINPFTHGSAVHTDTWKTEGLKQALEKHGFDAAFGGARRDEEKSRAKERIFSFRSAQHRWDPKLQRPELWRVYNARKNRGESMRVFPLSNWTELDVWQYIYLENIPIVPLYFSQERP